MKLKIQTKILVWYAIALTALISLYIVVVYSVLSQSTLTTAEDHVREETQGIAEDLEIEDDGPKYDEDDDSFSFVHDNVIFVILNGNQIAYGSSPATFSTPLVISLNRVTSQTDSVGGEWLIYDVTIDSTYTLRGYYSLENSVTTLHQFLLLMWIIAPLLIIVATIGGWWIIKRSFRPILAVTNTAEMIKNNQDYGLRIAFTDTHDEVSKLAKMINQMLDKMETAILRERDFASNVSHELRTPLTVLRAQLEYLLTKTADDKVQTDGVQMLAQLGYMDQVVQQFLELARVRHIHPEDFEQIDLVPFIDTLIQAITPMAEAQNITLVFSPSLPTITLTSSQTALTRILHNILTNAIKYNRPNGVVRVYIDRDNSSAIIKVEDNGIGMDEQTLKKVFDPFFRADASRTNQEGLGVGLTLTKELVEIMGGKITLTSTLSKGTIVTVQLPLSR